MGFQYLADTWTPGSFANRLRAKRLAMFTRLVEPLPKPLRIIDLGGTNEFWEIHGLTAGADFHVTLINLYAQPQRHPHIVPLVGDACSLPGFPDNAFDLVFSNSTIEHLFCFPRQKLMAREALRLAPACFIQTPNFYFPFEPHFHIPFWQFLPEAFRIRLLCRRRCGWSGPYANPADARRKVREIQLLSKRQLQTLFPQSEVIPEYFAGLVKSWTVVRGLFEWAAARGMKK